MFLDDPLNPNLGEENRRKHFRILNINSDFDAVVLEVTRVLPFGFIS